MAETASECTFVCMKDGDGALWLQGKRELPEAIVTRSEQLSTIRDALREADYNTKAEIPNLSVSAFEAWLLAVAAEDKALADLPLQQLAQILTAADFLKDTALLSEAAAAQRPRILAVKLKAHTEQPATASKPQAAPNNVYFSSDADGPLRWFEQLAEELPRSVLWTLLREAVGFPKHIGDGDSDEWLLALPQPLMAFAAYACSPCIEAHGAFHAQVRNAHCAQRVAALVRELRGELQEVFVKLPPPGQPDGRHAVEDGVEAVLASVCAVPALRTLHLGLHETNLTARTMACIAGHLSSASALKSLTVEVFTPDVPPASKDTTIGKEGHAVGGAARLTPLQSGIADTLSSLPQLQALKLVGLRGFEETFGAALRMCLPTMTSLRRLHAVDCAFQADSVMVLHLARALPKLKLCEVGPTPTTNAVIQKHGTPTFADSWVPDAERVTVQEPTRIRQTFRRLPRDASARPADGAGARPGYPQPHGRWEVIGADIGLAAVTATAGPTLAGGYTDDTYRNFRLDGGVWSGQEAGFELRHGVRFPSAPCAAAVLSRQQSLTSLYLGGEVQPHDDMTGDALAAVLAGLPSLRALGLRATGMPRGTGSEALGMRWEDIPGLVQALFETWAPVTMKLLRARESAAVPLERLSLELLHALRYAAATAPEAAAAEYSTDVGRVVAGIGRLTGLTSLDFTLNPRAVVPESVVAAVSQSLSSLGRLCKLRLAIAWSTSVPVEPFTHSLRQLSQLTELQLRLESRKGAPVGVNSLAKVALGLERAMVASGVAGEAAVRASGDGEHAAQAPGMTALRILRLGPLAKGFESAVQQVQRAGRHWKAAKGSSRLLGGVCVTAQHAEWLEAVRELQRVVGGAGDRLYVVLG